MNGGRAFFDTNVLLYMHSGADRQKQARAKELYREYATTDRILLSTQVVQEFFAVGSRKLKMPWRELAALTLAFLESPLVVLDASHIRAAMETGERYRINFWDALILAAAEGGGAEILYTEDLNDGQRYGSVLVRNPFRESEPAAG